MARQRWSFLMPPLEHGFIRVLDEWFRVLLTPMGRVLSLASIAGGLMLLGGLVRPLLLGFGFCVGALACGVAAGLPFRPRLRLTRRLPPPPSAGDEFAYQVIVENTGRRPVRNVVIEERKLVPELRPTGIPPLLERLEPGEKAEVTLRLHCRQRGAFELPALQAATTFPSGLVKVPRRIAGANRLLVYPRFTPMERFDVPHGRNHQPGGIPVASRIGESSEFFGTREWRDGDRLRDVHWPSLARTGRLIVKEFQEEYFVRLALVLDIESRSKREDAIFERSLATAAAIADALARQEYIVDLFAAGPEVFHFQAGRALAHLDNILEILACLEPGDRLDVDALEAVLLPEASRLSAVVLVMMNWDERRASLVRRLKDEGVAVRVICMKPGLEPDGLDPSEKVALP